jgi:hypothetical protein
MAACYLIRAWNFTAREAIGWLRVCRPGSVIGHQQTFVEKYADEYRRIIDEREEPAPVRYYQSTQAFLLNPQKGFHVFTEPMVDAYCNNPKILAPQSPRGVKGKWESGRLVPILTVPIASKSPKTTRTAKNRRELARRSTV